MTKRTDPHRPGAIVPAEYKYILSYNLPGSDGGVPFPSFGVNCEVDFRKRDEKGNILENGKHTSDQCCVTAINQSGVKRAGTGGTGHCSVCGVHFVYGDVWQHVPTGEFLHVGHTCADKYQMLTDRSAWELALDRVKAAAAREIQKKINSERREKFLNDRPGLAEALETKHAIVENIKEAFQRFGGLSDKQVALVFKLSTEAKLPPKEKEKNVPAPITGGRQTFEGEVVSAKVYQGNYGEQIKMTVKMTTPEGVWLAWGTAPQQLLDQVPNSGGRGRMQNLKGAIVKITATLRTGKDAHFAMMQRPHGTVVKQGPFVEAEATKAILEGQELPR